ncbi:hypothetical protein NDI37_16225, partial [Funiculus sociatus GB2-A5]
FLLPHLQFNVHIEALETMEANNSFLPSTASSVQLRNSCLKYSPLVLDNYWFNWYIYIMVICALIYSNF